MLRQGWLRLLKDLGEEAESMRRELVNLEARLRSIQAVERARGGDFPAPAPAPDVEFLRAYV